MQPDDPWHSVARGPPGQPQSQGPPLRPRGRPPQVRPSARGFLYLPLSRSVGGPVLSSSGGGTPGVWPGPQVCAAVQGGCPLHQRPPQVPPDTPSRVQAQRPSRSPSSWALSKAQGLWSRTFLLLPLTREEGGRGPARSPGRHHTVLRGRGNMRFSGPAARSIPRSAPWEPFGSPVASVQEGGRLAFPAAVGRLPLKRRAVARPAEHPLTRSLRLPAPMWRQDPGRGARRTLLTRSGLRWCSGPPHGSPLSLPVNLPQGAAQDNRRSLSPPGADGSSVCHLRLRGHAPTLSFRP
ncbi:hypothetical protein NDU88_002018 [Pleurodeles waltl]|uniref:Uncharacterized protein n=1 Tax=Pleurodeles waltl TaxID=8319 RepID=A0AAV7M4T1_PLEWA|nr:hypothetical protein NDU88_002018 [Pleurodeles waltl]